MCFSIVAVIKYLVINQHDDSYTTFGENKAFIGWSLC
jgi:hypothetical protein